MSVYFFLTRRVGSYRPCLGLCFFTWWNMLAITSSHFLELSLIPWLQHRVEVPWIIQPPSYVWALGCFQYLQLQTMLQRATWCICIFISLKVYVQDRFLEVEWVCQKVNTYWFCQVLSNSSPERFVPICIPISNVWESLFFLKPCQQSVCYTS